jgi:hypothetical protein
VPDNTATSFIELLWWRRRASAKRCPKPTLGECNEHTLVEAAGIEPLFPTNPNPMMANDFGFCCAKNFELQRRFDSPGVLPSLGDILETTVSRSTIFPGRPRMQCCGLLCNDQPHASCLFLLHP